MPIVDNKRKADESALVPTTKKSRNEVALSSSRDKSVVATVSC